jgi:serine/threonine protein kinase
MESHPERIGPYDVQRELGRGGMGIVYLARERESGHTVALKVLPREWTRDPGRLKRFQREARTIARVRHANVVPIYGVGEYDGLHCIAMKYIEGTSLDVLIRDQSGERLRFDEDTVVGDRDDGAAGHEPSPDRPIAPWAERRDEVLPAKPLSEPNWVYRAVRIAEKIARALGHLHEHGLVHRDVKPANILLDHRGDPWLADFGLVRDLEAESVSEDENIIGTVQYIAPERVEGPDGDADHRSDLYSLGVTLYEMVTLRRPFDGRGTSSTLYAVAREIPPPPRRLNPGLSFDLERVIQKAMAKDPADRYQSGAELADDLRRVRTFKPVEMARVPVLAQLKRFCSRNPVLACAIVFAALCLVGMLEYGIWREMGERRRLAECRQEADAEFARGRYRTAGEAYRLYLRLGGHDPGVIDRLAKCYEHEPEDGPPPPKRN